MAEAVIVSVARTPIARAHKGSFVDVDAFALARVAISAAVERSGVDVADIDDLALAEVLQGGGVIGRYVALELGLTNVPAIADNRHCAAGLGAVQMVAASIRAGMDRVAIAGGTESLSSMPQPTKSVPASARDPQPWLPPSHPETPDSPAWDMSITVGENTARLGGVTREDADAWALRSHQRARRSIERGWFDDEIVPVDVTDPSGRTTTVRVDEQPRADTSIERLAALRPLHPTLPGATVTAGNASGVNDAAAAVIVTSDEYAAAHGLRPLARVVSWASVGVDPVETGLAPTLAIPKALQRAGMGIDDVGLFEINEAFCSVAVACTRRLGIDAELVNVNGSGCGLGHPVAATGVRMVVTMINELRRRDLAIGCVSLCAGGGMGSALVLELL